MKFYINTVKAWAPGIENGLGSIKNEKLSPKIEFTDAMFRRRFSQLTKMTIQVVHDVIEGISKLFLLLSAEKSKGNLQSTG